MTTEKFIKEVNQERETEKSWLQFEKNTETIMKCANITYRTAINGGFTETQALQMAYQYFYELQTSLNRK
jgi:hypothetical protein